MTPPRLVHIFGASGSGTTTLGRALATALGCPHVDTDDFYWLPTDPPFVEKRTVAERCRLLEAALAPSPGWVLSGWLGSWGDIFVPQFDFAVFLSTPTAVRVARLRTREAAHFGAAAIAPGGPQHAKHEEFIAWAASYEAGEREGRSRAVQEAWLARLPCPVLRLSGEEPTEALVAAIIAGRFSPGN